MRFKTIEKNKKLTAVIVVLLILSLVLAAAFLRTTEPVNPINERQGVSSMWNSEKSLLADMDKINSFESANISSGSNQDENLDKSENQEMREDQGETQESHSNTESITNTPDIAQIVEIDGNSQAAGDRDGNNNGSSDQGNDTSDEGENVDAYFSTSIISGDIVTYSNYSFTIKHLKPELTVKGMSVTLNGKEETYAPKTGRFELNLQEGENRIIVKVLYSSGNSQITASKGYTLYYAPAGEVIIVTDLYDRTIDQDSISFEAYGLRGQERLSTSVKVNGKKVSSSGDRFKAELELGRNVITITAGGRNDSVTRTYTITYAENIFKITTTLSSTVLYGTENQTSPEPVTYVSDATTCRFKVHVNQVTGKENIIQVRVFTYDGTNGKILTKGADGYYSFELPTRQYALVTLRYSDSQGKEHQYQYILRYKRAGETTPVDKYPQVNARVEVGQTIMNLETGMKFKSPTIIVNINARSWQNEPLYGSDFTVTANGYKYPQNNYQEGNTWYGYEMTLKEGENIVTITVTDADQYSVTKTYKLYYTPGNVKVTVSIEATTVGLGYLVQPQMVEVEGGTSVAEIVTDLLKKNGYTYSSTGTVDTGFYLASINKPGITNGYKIPSDLIAMIEADGGDISMSMGEPSANRLGEFDFYRYSGWMYSYNGSYPAYSMSSCKPQDGAVIRVRFTLALGKDIGGYSTSGGTYEGNIKGNYGKEW